jgi:hypothetical protein
MTNNLVFNEDIKTYDLNKLFSIFILLNLTTEENTKKERYSSNVIIVTYLNLCEYS